MNVSIPYGSVDSYLSAQWTESGFGLRKPASAQPFITISREAGSGGSSFGSLLARQLNSASPDGVHWRVFEGNLIAKMLEQHHLPARIGRYLPEGRIPESRALLGEWFGLHPNLWDLIQKTNAMMRHLAGEGHVILVGRGANFATAGLENGTHVRLVAPAEQRARYLADRYNISEKEALSYNARCEAARRRYVKAYFGADVADTSAYTLVLNMATVSLAGGAQLVTDYIARRYPET